MHSLTSIVSLLSLSLPVLASNGYNTCSKSPYSSMLPLSGYSKAMSYCSANYPIPGCTIKSTSVITKTSVLGKTTTVKTVTSTAGTSTKLATAATTTSTVYTSTVTSTSTTGTIYFTVTAPTVTVTSSASTTVTTTQVNTETDLTTQTSTSIASETDTVTETTTYSTTITTTYGVVPNNKRAIATADLPPVQVRPANEKRGYSPQHPKRGSPQPASVTLESMYCSLTKKSPDYQCTACSCIETPAPCPTVTKTASVTSTSLTSVTATLQTTATVTSSVTVTSTTQAASTTTTSVGAISPTTLTPTATTVITITITNIETYTTTLVQTITAQATSTSTELTTTTSTISSTATSTVYPNCASGYDCVDGNDFYTLCGQYANVNGYTPAHTVTGVADGQACVQACSDEAQCNYFTFDYNTQICLLYDNIPNGVTTYTSDPAADSGYYIGSC